MHYTLLFKGRDYVDMEEIKPRVELFCLVTPECKRHRCGLYVFFRKTIRNLHICTEGWDCDLDFVMGLAFVALLMP